jgi:integrase
MVRTKNGLPKHCGWNTDHHGKRRVRFRKRGFSVYLTGTPWSEDFMRQYAAALEGVKLATNNVGANSRTIPGSFNALIVSWYRTDFRRLKPSTQRHWRYLVEKEIRSKHGDKSVARLERKHIKNIMGAMVATPQAANNLLKVLRVLLNYAVDIGMIRSNPAIGVKSYESHGDGFHTWTEDEIPRFEERHSIGTKARLAFALLLYTGQRRSDVIRLGWQHVQQRVDGDVIAVRQKKTDKPLLIPIHPELARALAAVPKTNMTFLINERSTPFEPEGFSNWFRRRCNEAGLPQCSAHGLRKAAGRKMAEAGCSANQIAAVLGHASLQEVARYTKAADQERLARQALNMQLRAEREQDLSNLATQLDKTPKSGR